MSKRNFILFFLLLINSISLFSQTEIMKNRHWLWYVKDWEWSESFYKEFEKNIPLLFESQLNKKLNWNRIWLFIPPGTIYEKRIINGKKCFYISEALS